MSQQKNPEKSTRNKSAIVLAVLCLIGVFLVLFLLFPHFGKSGNAFSLSKGETFRFKEGGLELTLLSISDSRCPPRVQCFWQGEIGANVSVRDSSGELTIYLGTVRQSKADLGNSGWMLEILESSTKDRIYFRIYNGLTILPD